MSATAVQIEPICRNCGAVLKLDEIHYYDQGDGTATCNKCESDWLEAMHEWRSGNSGIEPPAQP